MEGRAGIGVLVAAAQHVLEGRAGVKPHFQNVGALGVVLGASVRAQDVFGTVTRLQASMPPFSTMSAAWSRMAMVLGCNSP
jgi:phosphate/sulfate permease